MKKPAMAKQQLLPTGSTVAVFDILDRSNRTGENTRSQLTDYLITQVSEISGFKVIPRDRLRKKIAEQKVKGYGLHYDKKHQAKLGKAMAAKKIITSKLLRVGKTCALTSNLYDLETETLVIAASAETDCSPDSLMNAVRKIAKKLKHKGR